MTDDVTIRPDPGHGITGRVLGVAGILGGLFLLAAFVVDIPPNVNTARIYAFLIGSLAVVVGVSTRVGGVAPGRAWVAALPALLGIGGLLVWELLATGRPSPFAGDFGLVGFYLALLSWLGSAWFGLMTFRMGGLARWASLALAVGSLLAVLGIDRLGLTSSSEPTIFGPISLAGIGLSGIAWVLLGLDLLLRAQPHQARVSSSA